MLTGSYAQLKLYSGIEQYQVLHNYVNQLIMTILLLLV